MSRKPKSFRPSLISLESRRLLNASPHVSLRSAEVSVLGDAAPRSGQKRINVLKGDYSASRENRIADKPLRVNLTGSGKVKWLGRVRMEGVLNFGGFLPRESPSLQGQVTLTNTRGRVTLVLTGFDGHSTVPGGTFLTTASVGGDTGAFKNLLRIGNVRLGFGPITAPSPASPSTTPLTGTLTMALSLVRPRR